MFESNVVWIEALTQISIAIPFCFLIEKSVGYRKICKRIPTWMFMILLYTSWNIYNVIVLWYPQLVTNVVSEAAAYKIRAGSGLLMMFVIIPQLYQGTILERYFACFLIEVISLFGGLFRYACMLLLKNSGFYYEFEKKILLMLVFRLFIECTPYFLFYFLFKKQFKQYHAFVKKHKKICTAATLLIINIEIITAFITVSRGFLEKLRFVVGGIFLLVVFNIVIYLYKRDNERVYTQKRLLENHYQPVKIQTEQIEKMQSEIGKLLEAAEMLEKQKVYDEKDLRYYGEELKKIHSKLQRVDYCDNLMLDAVLHNKAKECEENQIKLEIRMQDLSFGKIQDIDMFEIVYEMLEIAIGKAKLEEEESLRNIVISGKNLAGQVVIETKFPAVPYGEREDKKQYRRVKRKVRKCKGTCVRSAEEKTEKIIIGIGCE